MSKRSLKASEIIIRELIKPRMISIDITAYQLAKDTGITESKLSLWLNGKQDITLGIFFDILKALKIDKIEVI